MENGKKILWIIVGIVVIAALFAIFSNRERAENNGLSDRGDENTYVSSEYGLSFDIPEGYEVLEVTSTSTGRHSIVLSMPEVGGVPENGEGPTAITADIFTRSNAASPDGWVRQNPGISNFNIIRGDISTSTSVDGAPAVRYFWDGLYLGRSVVFLHQDNIIMFSGTYMSEDDPIFSDFDEVISSIKLKD